MKSGRDTCAPLFDAVKGCIPTTKAANLLRSLGNGLPLTRDLTDKDETLKVLEIASAIVASGEPLQDFKDACYGDANGNGAGPTVLVSAVGSAESKMQMKDCGPFHMVCLFAMYGEQNRIQQKAGHPNGQDFIRMKVKQLEWLFSGEEGKTWEIVAVDDGCPNDSKTLARKVVEAENLGDRVKVLDLEDAVKEGLPYFTERGLKTGCKESRKGGAILYGLYTAATRQVAAGAPPLLAMYTDSDLSTDMSLCGVLAHGVLVGGGKMSMGARYGAAETFLVKPPDFGPSGHPQSHFEQPNMMKIVMRHYVRVRLLPILKGIYDTQCAFKCFRASDLKAILEEVRSLGADFDMELLLCALSYFRKGGGSGSELCVVKPTLFTEDFAESNFMASSDDPDKPYKTYAGMNQALVQMHKRYIDQASDEAKAVTDLVAFADGITWEAYKRMVLKLEKDHGPTLFDYDFPLDELKAACAE